jgi:hypothetical protein
MRRTEAVDRSLHLHGECVGIRQGQRRACSACRTNGTKEIDVFVALVGRLAWSRLDQAEPYGDCLTYGPGHYETWAHWRRDRTVDPALRALVRSYEYEDWPRGRIVFDRARDLFVLYADRKLLTPATIACIKAQFHLPAERTEVKSDLHYQSTETPNALRARSCQP